MYGAKANAIAKAANDTWGKPANFEKVKDGLSQAVQDIYDAGTRGEEIALEDLDVPKEFKTAEFVKLAKSLANNPLVS